MDVLSFLFTNRVVRHVALCRRRVSGVAGFVADRPRQELRLVDAMLRKSTLKSIGLHGPQHERHHGALVIAVRKRIVFLQDLEPVPLVEGHVFRIR